MTFILSPCAEAEVEKLKRELERNERDQLRSNSTRLTTMHDDEEAAWSKVTPLSGNTFESPNLSAQKARRGGDTSKTNSSVFKPN